MSVNQIIKLIYVIESRIESDANLRVSIEI